MLVSLKTEEETQNTFDQKTTRMVPMNGQNQDFYWKHTHHQPNPKTMHSQEPHTPKQYINTRLKYK